MKSKEALIVTDLIMNLHTDLFFKMQEWQWVFFIKPTFPKEDSSNKILIFLEFLDFPKSPFTTLCLPTETTSVFRCNLHLSA